MKTRTHSLTRDTRDPSKITYHLERHLRFSTLTSNFPQLLAQGGNCDESWGNSGQESSHVSHGSLQGPATRAVSSQHVAVGCARQPASRTHGTQHVCMAATAPLTQPLHVKERKPAPTKRGVGGGQGPHPPARVGFWKDDQAGTHREEKASLSHTGEREWGAHRDTEQGARHTHKWSRVQSRTRRHGGRHGPPTA